MERKNKATANNSIHISNRSSNYCFTVIQTIRTPLFLSLFEKSIHISNCWFIEIFFVICCNYSVAFVTNLKYWMCDILHLVFEIWTCFSISERKYIDMLILRFVPKIYIMNQSWINQSLI